MFRRENLVVRNSFNFARNLICTTVWDTKLLHGIIDNILWFERVSWE